MDLTLCFSSASQYKNQSQIARVITEKWVTDNIFCPRCGAEHIEHLANNRPVADFLCPKCSQIYELKSKSGFLGHEIADGSYQSMIKRIESDSSPDFFFMTYQKSTYTVKNFLIIPKHYFSPSIIKQRKPLASTARRAGWVGCNIDLSAIPSDGRIFIVKDGTEENKENVLKRLRKTAFLESTNTVSRGWLLDVMLCMDKLNKASFTLSEMYYFEKQLGAQHPDNKNVRAKIRQQLQMLRDKGYIEFCGKGVYRKLGE